MHDEDSEDLGAPVTELLELESQPRTGFRRGIRNRIERKAFAGNLLDLSIPMLGQVLIQYLNLIFLSFDNEEPKRPREDESDE